MWKLALARGSDATWVRRALDDQPDAFEVLVLRYQKKAHAIAQAVGVPWDAAEDVVQEAFLKAFRSLPLLRQPESFGSWFLNIVRNEARMHYRSGRRRPCGPLPDFLEATRPEPPEAVEFRELLWEKVAEIPEPVREAIFLYYHEGKSIREVARALEITRAAALKRLERGRGILREKLWRELEDFLRDILPSDREWTLKGRQVAILIVGAVATSWGIRSPAAVAGCWIGSGGPARIGLTWKVAAGGLEMAEKKTIILACTLCVILGGLFLTLYPGRRGEKEAASRPTAGQRPGAVHSSQAIGKPKAPKDPASEVKRAEAAPPADARSPLLAGKVLSREGKPIAGAMVTALDRKEWDSVADRTGSDASNVLTLENPEDHADLKRAYLSMAEKSARTTSDAAGDYTFYELAEGEHQILAVHEDYLPSAENRASIQSGTTARCDIVMDVGQGIAGRVKDEAGGQIAGASIVAGRSEDRRLGGMEKNSRLVQDILDGKILVGDRKAMSVDDGSFRIGSLEPMPYDLVVFKDGFAAARLFDIPVGKSGLKVVLSRGLAVRGRLIHPDRKPAEGAEVTVLPPPRVKGPPPSLGSAKEEIASEEDVDERAREARTDPDGKFEFTGLRPGVHRIRARKEGFGSLELEVELVDQPVDVGDQKLVPFLSIRGKVVGPSGEPIAGARLWIEEPRREGIPDWGGRFSLPHALAEARSEGGGEFLIDGLPEGVFALRASARDFAPATVPYVAAGSEGVEIVLREGRVLRGVVLNGLDGTPVAGADVILLQGNTAYPVSEKRAETGADGRFEIRGAPLDDRYLGLQVGHPAYGRPRELELQGQNLEAIEVNLFPADRIAGRILDPAGSPVAGAGVRFEAPRYKTSGLLQAISPGSEFSRSVADGSFFLEVPRGLRRDRGSLEIVARHPSLGSGRSPSITAPEGTAPWPDVEIVLQPLSALTGKVLDSDSDSDGKPIPRAVLRATRIAGVVRSFIRPGESREFVLHGESREGYSDAKGSYRIADLEPGAYLVEVRAEGYAPRKIDAIEIGREFRVEDIFLDSGNSLRGKVTDDRGNPVPGAEVIAMEADPDDGEEGERTEEFRRGRRFSASGIASARTDATGNYELFHLPEVELTLVARAPDHEPSQLLAVRPGDAPDDLVLVRLGALAGTVVDAETGRPVPLFQIHAQIDGELRPALRLIPREFDDPRGAFAIDGLIPGKYRVAITAIGYGTLMRDVMVAPGKAERFPARLEKGFTLRGTVVDLDTGEGILGAHIAMDRRDQLVMSSLSSSAAGEWSAEDGSFSIRGLLPGEYWFFPSQPSSIPEKGCYRVMVGEEDPAPMKIGMRRAGMLEGKVGRLENWWRMLLILQPVEEEKRKEGSEERPLRMDLRGVSSLGPTGEGRYKVTMVPPGTYDVLLEEEFPKPHFDGTKSGIPIRPEDMEHKVTVLGRVEIRAGQTTSFDLKRP
jgi:RNA polymerase sigma-70 factor (ECF subfamily)